MRRFNNKLLDSSYLGYRFIAPIVDPVKAVKAAINYPKYFSDLYKYKNIRNSEKIEFINMFPVLSDNTSTTPFDLHYFYQDIWAAKKIFKSKVKEHYDVGSTVKFVGFLSVFTKVKFIDIRPIIVKLSNIESIKGDLLKLPFDDNSLRSVSCLHVAEHIGLGRYGDELDVDGTKKACKELSRVLKKKGNLYFGLPVGKPRLCFNAHRIHSPKQIIKYFNELNLIELSGITDDGKFIENIDINILEKSDYACGLFHFRKK